MKIEWKCEKCGCTKLVLVSISETSGIVESISDDLTDVYTEGPWGPPETEERLECFECGTVVANDLLESLGAYLEEFAIDDEEAEDDAGGDNK